MKQVYLLFFLSFLISVRIYSQPNCSASSTGFIPINDLGTNISPLTGQMGGLYPGGSNYLPGDHKNAGLELASQIECLDINGNPDPYNGKVVWLSIGMSNCTQETQRFIPLANAFPTKNPKLLLVDGAQGGQTAQVISAPWHSNYSTFWNTVNNRLTNQGVSAQQVQIIWLKEANQAGNTPPTQHYDSLLVQLKRITHELKKRFPNVKLCYVASRISARYATTTLNHEPYAYLTGWAVKKMIEDQIMGDPQLRFSGPDAKSPWLSWGIYMWSDGNTPQISNPDIFYNCPTDFMNDGIHPSTAGAQKVGNLLLKFFSTDSTSIPWFLGNPCSVSSSNNLDDSENNFTIHPNPTNGFINVSSNNQTKLNFECKIINLHGQVVFYKKITSITKHTPLDISHLQAGVYKIIIVQEKKIQMLQNLMVNQ
ncbi:MAG: T9SS type A sorting domain-containing protein [Saprospiraceae bacterium]|nr:T9SS type A sorting domain-containing protein [Saprospiraceae bacterium]MBK9630812.1 T9SS type A sorting domain-containing protein [Saprospiraceae bacterium]